MPREKRLSARQPKHQDSYSDSEDDSDREAILRSPPKKAKKNSTTSSFVSNPFDELTEESAGIMTPVIKTSNMTTLPSVAPAMHQAVPSLLADLPIQSFPCGMCCKEVSDDDAAIFCESGCSQWYHRECAGLTEKAYDLLTNEENADWVCDQCISKKNIPLVKLKS